jgi:hypothetical protein
MATFIFSSCVPGFDFSLLPPHPSDSLFYFGDGEGSARGEEKKRDLFNIENKRR